MCVSVYVVCVYVNVPAFPISAEPCLTKYSCCFQTELGQCPTGSYLNPGGTWICELTSPLARPKSYGEVLTPVSPDRVLEQLGDAGG